MARTVSPLRYPGGKACLSPILSQLIKDNELRQSVYAEPFAGGCGLALTLLMGSHVGEIHINDIDPAIWSFWHSVLNETEEFIERMHSTTIDVQEWRLQREVYLAKDINDLLGLGFATFFLNRVNRSGIIKDAGVIGGLKQEGPYKMDCRYNKADLERKIRRISKYKKRIYLSNLDAIDFLNSNDSFFPKRALFCIDPPYCEKGSSLYTNFYTESDHRKLSSVILNMQTKWVLTYDNAPLIRNLYKHNDMFVFDIKYSIQTKRIGTELLITSRELLVPKPIYENKINGLLTV